MAWLTLAWPCLSGSKKRCQKVRKGVRKIIGHRERDLWGLRIDDHSPARRWDSISSPGTPARQLETVPDTFSGFKGRWTVGPTRLAFNKVATIVFVIVIVVFIFRLIDALFIITQGIKNGQ